MHIDCRIANAAGLGPYARMCCKGCCRTCTYLEDCTYSCHEAAEEKKAIKQRKREKSAEEREEKRAKEAPERNILLSTYNRIRQIRIEKGISQEAFLEASLGYCYGNELEKLDAAELGEKLNLNTRMPGGIWPRDVLKIIATADLLGISIDEMYGHKVPGKAADAPVAPTGDTCTGNAWQTGDPITVGKYSVLTRLGNAEKPIVTSMMWDGNQWMSGAIRLDDLDAEVLSWVRLPAEVQ